MTSATAEIAEMPKMGALRAFWEFTRPHTIIGTTLAVGVFYVLAAHAAGVHDVVVLLGTYLASLSVNIYIVGLNQITDVEIDRINKPYLPIAAGAFTRNTAVAIVATSGVLAITIAALMGPYLFGTIAIVFTLGSIYRLPPLRLKRSPFWAAFAITLARAVVGNCGVYLTYSHALSGEAALPPHVLLFVGFMLGFVVVIAIMKDVPDIEGDRRHDISTLVTRLGAARTMLLCRVILSVAYLGMVIAALVGVPGVHAGVLAGTHLLALVAIWGLARKLDADDGEAVYRYYMFIWKLFYLEFVVFPVACLLS